MNKSAKSNISAYICINFEEKFDTAKGIGNNYFNKYINLKLGILELNCPNRIYQT